MAYDKIIDSARLDGALTATANKIRSGTGVSGKIVFDPDTGFTGSIPAGVEQATPGISVSSAGLITASATQGAGIVKSGTKSATKQLSVQEAKTVTPGATDQTAVASGVYTTGAITVKGDANLKAENIADGVSIFGITGTHSGGGNVATGYVVISYTNRYKITVSGLGFTPSNVLMMYDAYGAYGGTGSGLGFSSSIAYAVLGFAAGDYNMWQMLNSDGTLLHGEDFTTVQLPQFNVSLGASSFTAQTSSSSNYKFITGGVYRYVVW